jgi:glyoxylase-like metal-dependent hydrolase (beta-lactamase superfamily II)
LIVDSGINPINQGKLDWLAPEKWRPVFGFMEGCTNITVVITHTHYDHFSLLNHLLESEYGSRIRAVFCPGYPHEKPYSEFKRGFFPITKVEKFSDVSSIVKSLGDDIDVFPIVPLNWRDRKQRTGDPNDNSMPLVICDRNNNKKFLLT